MRLLSRFVIASFFLSIAFVSKAQSTADSTQSKWWKEAIVYQIYPRSFKDSDGDGVGDLKGIISQLDYLKSLGITVVWLNPIYASPNDDNGYDVSDYRAIQKEYGTMQDFDNLLKGLHDRGIRLIMDFVFNHSSDEHEWFKQSKSSRNSPYRDYYHWWNAEDGKLPYRYSLFDINHDAWKYDSATNAYYFHIFSRKQPDLNWENPKLRQELYGIMKFWRDKGIDGYRLDAFQFAAKDTTFPMFPPHFEDHFSRWYAMQGNLHGYLQEMNKEVFKGYDLLSVAEGAGNSFEDAHNLVDVNRKELNMAYPFEGVDLPKSTGYSLLSFKEVFSKWDSAFAQNGWLAVFLSNHDQARLVSRYGDDSPAFREPSSKMLTTFLFTMRGTPYYYYGDELGMTNIRFNTISDYRDMAALNEYKHIQNTTGDTAALLKEYQFSERDNGRTPMQWNAAANAGFSTSTPWIKVNPNAKTVNVQVEEKDPNSVLSYFKKMTALRKANPALVYGKYTLLDQDNPNVYAYTREWNGNKFLILLNFKSTVSSFSTKIDMTGAALQISNYKTPSKGNTLQPYEAVVYKLK